jgi:hypothetical protein
MADEALPQYDFPLLEIPQRAVRLEQLTERYANRVHIEGKSCKDFLSRRLDSACSTDVTQPGLSRA